ncbi:diguanylate cyclase/phosphodiesterase (GGDEF & EAL domains) with PAS/PAC sensor(s) [Rhodovulum sp. P5]|nr:diguanylate cyclase/phosphodiesterase (GGDEF & EAL domains) with PAS/PAC sensor(s) [Rhodovulum sp. P5]
MRYVFAIGLILVFLGSAHLVNLHSIKASEADAETINVSGRQRMLSQRVVFLAEHAVQDPDPVYDAELVLAVGQFADGHAWLLKNALRSPEARALYFDPDGPRLDRQVAEFLRLSKEFLALRDQPASALPVLRQMEDMAIADLLESLNAAVTLFEAEATERTARLEQMHHLALQLTLLILVLEAIFVFWPAQRTVTRSLNKVVEQNRRLLTRNDELDRLSRELDHAARHDHLTGLANRKKLYEELETLLADRRESGRAVCVMAVDLDRFKEVNDTLGHAMGDAVLKQVGDTMLAIVRKGDIVARTGGDEFVIVLPFSSRSERRLAQAIAERIADELRRTMIIDDQECMIGASVGYAFADEDSIEASGLITKADIALYEAKRAGKGIALAFNESMRDRLERRHALIQDFDRAFRDCEFVPYFQPQISCTDGRLIGFEVLARWDHGKQGLIMPNEFIPLAEETRQIDVIDGRIIFRALESLSELRSMGWDVPTLSLNASGRILRDPQFPDYLMSMIRMHGLKPSDIVVEILETVLIEHESDQALISIQRIAAAGVAVHIDDFGTGYASLSKLAMLDISGLKIDRSLIIDLQNEKSAKVVDAIVGLARSMSLDVVAEGVETSRQFDTLAEMGCDKAQGYAIGVPMAKGEVPGWLERFEPRPVAV